MNKLLIERVNYFTGEALLTDDFKCEQNYIRETAAIAKRSLYTYGIAHGLDVRILTSKVNPSVAQVEVAPGVAIDAMGRQIILLEKNVLQLSEIETGVNYYITINFNEIYADYSNETGTAGYKRVIEAPQLRYLRNLDQPGLNILLAIAKLAADGTLSPLLASSGNKQRRYVATSVGAVNFITEGAGIDSALVSAEMLGANLLTRYASIRAKPEGENSSSYLEFDANRGAFKNMLTVRGNLGVGNDSPSANLQVDTITFDGAGTITSDNTQVTIKGELPCPNLHAGDSIIAWASVSGGPPQKRQVQKVDASGTLITIDRAFKNNLIDVPYSYIRSTLARFSNTSGSETSLLEVLNDGRIGLGVQAGIKSGDTKAGPNALVITADRKVGIALNSGTPQVTLDVNGPINATALTTTGLLTTTDINASGAIKAQSFEGNGSKLQGMTKLSYWTKVDPTADLSNLYYNSGNVGIKNSTPTASLSVGGGSAFIGSGVITSLSDLKLVGYNTQFKDQIKVGDILAIGTLNNQISTVLGKPTSDNSLLMASQFEVPVIGSSYSYQAPNGIATQGKGTVSSNGTTLIGTDTQFTQLDDGYFIIIPRFNTTSTLEQSQTVSTTPTSDTELTLKSSFVGQVKDLPYSYINPTTKVKTVGKGSISASGTTVTGTGTNFKTDFVENSLIYTNPVQTNSDMPLRWTVASVEDQFNLTLQTDGGLSTVEFTAANSAYMVSTGLLGQFLANDQNGILTPEQEATLPASMLVLTNSVLDSTKPDQAANTVAVNTAYKDVLRRYALQVTGDTNLSGDIHGGNLTVETLLATKFIKVAANDTSSANILLDANGNVTTSATVQATGVVSSSASIQAPTVYASSNLQANGSVYANNSSGTVQGYNLQSAQLNTTGMQVNVTGTAQIAFSGTMQIMGERTTYTQNDLKTTSPNNPDSVQNTWSASTDGLVVAMIGQPKYDKEYAGVMTGWTQDRNGQTTSTQFVTMTTDVRTVSLGKKGSQTYYVPIPGLFTMPVRNGENWSIMLTTNSVFGATPNVTIYWIPFGSVTAAMSPILTNPTPPSPPTTTVSEGVPDAVSAVVPMHAIFRADASAQDVRSPTVASNNAEEVDSVEPPLDNHLVESQSDKESIEFVPIHASDTISNNGVNDNFIAQRLLDDLMTLDGNLGRIAITGSVSGTAQEEINKRVADLTRIFGDATGMSSDQVPRSDFVQNLQKIVCSADIQGQAAAEPLLDEDVQSLIDSFAKASGKTFSSQQRSLLDAGVKALVQINDSEANRHNLNLIKQNIDLFLNNVQQVLSTNFSSDDKRLLTRALMRLVGDGRQGDNLPSATPAVTTATTSDVALTTPIIPLGSNVDPNSSAANNAASSIALQLRQTIESSIGSVVNSDVKSALTQIVDAALQGGSVEQASTDLLQKIAHLLPATLGDAGKQILQSQLSQLLTEHAYNAFVGELEQALQTKLADGEKDGFKKIVGELISGKGTKESVGLKLFSEVESVAKDTLEVRAKNLVSVAITKLLAALM